MVSRSYPTLSLPCKTSNHAMELTPGRRTIELSTIRTLQFAATLALARRSSSWSR